MKISRLIEDARGYRARTSLRIVSRFTRVIRVYNLNHGPFFPSFLGSVLSGRNASADGRPPFPERPGVHGCFQSRGSVENNTHEKKELLAAYLGAPNDGQYPGTMIHILVSLLMPKLTPDVEVSSSDIVEGARICYRPRWNFGRLHLKPYSGC